MGIIPCGKIVRKWTVWPKVQSVFLSSSSLTAAAEKKQEQAFAL
jgi:hypothetical protein